MTNKQQYHLILGDIRTSRANTQLIPCDTFSPKDHITGTGEMAVVVRMEALHERVDTKSVYRVSIIHARTNDVLLIVKFSPDDVPLRMYPVMPNGTVMHEFNSQSVRTIFEYADSNYTISPGRFPVDKIVNHKWTRFKIHPTSDQGQEDLLRQLDGLPRALKFVSDGYNLRLVGPWCTNNIQEPIAYDFVLASVHIHPVTVMVHYNVNINIEVDMGEAMCILNRDLSDSTEPLMLESFMHMCRHVI